MFPPDIKKSTITIEFAIAAYAHYMGVTREEAGASIIKPRFFGGLVLLEETPFGLLFNAKPDRPGFYSLATIHKAFREGKEPDGANQLLIAAKRFFLKIKEEKGCKELGFDPERIYSVGNVEDDLTEIDDFYYIQYKDELKTSNYLNTENEELKAENERLKQENAELKTRQAMNAAITPGNPLFQHRILLAVILNAEFNDPPPERMRDITATISDFLTSHGIDINRMKTSIEHIAWLIAQRECGKPIEEAPEWEQIIFNATGHGAMLGLTGET